MVTLATGAECFLFEGKITLLGRSGCLHHTLLHIILACRPISQIIELFTSEAEGLV